MNILLCTCRYFRKFLLVLGTFTASRIADYMRIEANECLVPKYVDHLDKIVYQAR